MVASYSQEGTIEQAFKDTFGGERPCEMCKIITAVEDSENETPLNTGESKKLTLMLGLAKPILITVPEAVFKPVVRAQTAPENALLRVPTPPPRVA